MTTIQECNSEVSQATDMLAETERSQVYTSPASIDRSTPFIRLPCTLSAF